MKRSRQSFLVGSAAAGAGLLSIGTVPIAAAPTTSPTPTPSPSPTPAPSASARAQALSMRRFDAALSDDEIDSIAGNIDQAATAAASLNPHGTKLQNGDAPDPQYRL